EADRSLVDVRLALLDEALGGHAAPLHRVELEGDGSVPVDPQPQQRALDLLDGVLDLAARVGVLDPQEDLAAAPAREQPVEEKRAHAADVQEARRGRRHTDADGHRPTMVVACGSAATSRRRAGSTPPSTG